MIFTGCFRHAALQAWETCSQLIPVLRVQPVAAGKELTRTGTDMKRNIADLPLHTGKAPRWLFERMVRLAGGILMAVTEEYGPREVLRRLSDPWWFQAFGCVLGFDWHSSGLTTVTCGAVKEAYGKYGKDLGIIAAGGKGSASRKTPAQIKDLSEKQGITSGDELIYISRMSAKVDSSCIQDGYQIYAHSIFFTDQGEWCVVQQGMNQTSRYARRYHWLGESVQDICIEPHNGLYDTGYFKNVPEILLNMTAREAGGNREGCLGIIKENPDRTLKSILRYSDQPSLFVPEHHLILPSDVNIKRLRKSIIRAHESAPQDFAALLGVDGMGPSSIRALSLLAELIYSTPASHKDPADHGVPVVTPGKKGETAEKSAGKWADYSYAHGGKDGTPFPVTKGVYDRNIDILHDSVKRAGIGNSEKKEALKRIAGLMS